MCCGRRRRLPSRRRYRPVHTGPHHMRPTACNRPDKADLPPPNTHTHAPCGRRRCGGPGPRSRPSPPPPPSPCRTRAGFSQTQHQRRLQSDTAKPRVHPLLHQRRRDPSHPQVHRTIPAASAWTPACVMKDTEQFVRRQFCIRLDPRLPATACATRGARAGLVAGLGRRLQSAAVPLPHPRHLLAGLGRRLQSDTASAAVPLPHQRRLVAGLGRRRRPPLEPPRRR